FVFFFQAEEGIRDFHVTGVQTCALPISGGSGIGMGLAAAWRERRGSGHAAEGFTSRDGPAAILAGSCSSATLGQIAHHEQRHPRSEERRVGKEGRTWGWAAP